MDLVASAADVRDFMACPQLAVVYPKDYVAPDGTRPGSPEAIALPSDGEIASADRVARAESEASRAKLAQIAADRDVGMVRAQTAGEIADLKGRLADAEQRLGKNQAAVAEAERARVAATERADKAEHDKAVALAQMRREHVAATDTLRAQHAAELETLGAEHDRTVAAMSAEMDRAMTPAASSGNAARASAKPRAGAGQPAGVPG